MKVETIYETKTPIKEVVIRLNAAEAAELSIFCGNVSGNGSMRAIIDKIYNNIPIEYDLFGELHMHLKKENENLSLCW